MDRHWLRAPTAFDVLPPLMVVTMPKAEPSESETPSHQRYPSPIQVVCTESALWMALRQLVEWSARARRIWQEARFAVMAWHQEIPRQTPVSGQIQQGTVAVAHRAENGLYGGSQIAVARLVGPLRAAPGLLTKVGFSAAGNP